MIDDTLVQVGSDEDLRENGPQLVHAGGRSIAVFYHEEKFHAVDNRCPHMGFSLTQGTVDDGILTCHWHHARYDLACGDTFDPWADDIQTYPVEVRDGEVYVDPDPERDESLEERWTHRLEDGLQDNIWLVIAKAVVGLDDAGVPYTEPLRIGAEFGTHYRQDGWGRGLTVLSVMANLRDDLRLEDRRRALYWGLADTADECAGEPPFFVKEPFDTRDHSAARLNDWFRENIEVRDADGAERVLRTAIQADLPKSDIAAILAGAATDHRYLSTGHVLDFINKAFDLLDHIGWNHADDVLPRLIPGSNGLANAQRAEETSSWRQPIDVAALLFDVYDELPALVEAGAERSWTEPDDFVEVLLGDDPSAIVDTLTEAVEQGATAEELAQVVTYAATRRVAQFGTANEFNDWNTVHHTFSYANAVHGISHRTDAWELYRGIFDAAMSVYLDRFLNTPPAPIPEPSDSTRAADEVLDDLVATFDVEEDRAVDRAGRLTAGYLNAGGDVDALKQALGQALLREDAGFHPRQNLEAAFTQHTLLDDPERQRVTLIAAARYLSAHTPTRREGEQTFRIADRLNRGEKLHEAAETPASGGE